jgi:NADPH-dependent curcumin reductase
VLQKRVRLQGFVILDHYGDRFDTFRREMAAWVANGQVKLRENDAQGVEQAPGRSSGCPEGRKRCICSVSQTSLSGQQQRR